MEARDYPFCQFPLIVLAHRGGADMKVNEGIENTIAAFRNAVDLGCTHLETDVHATSDGVLLAFHDAVLDRVTDASGVVATMPWSEVSRARVGTEPIPTLDEVLETFPDTFVNIDIKHEGAIDPLVDVLGRHDAWRRVCVASFSTRRLRAFRRLAGTRAATAIAPLGVAWGRFGGLRLPLGRPAGVAYQVPRHIGPHGFPLVTPRFVAAAHRIGRAVHVWTVNDVDEAVELIDMGVDGIVTDRPDLMLPLAGGRS